MRPSTAAHTARPVPEERPTNPGRPGSGLRSALVIPLALWWACRPRQWLKNLLVFAAPATAGVLFDVSVLLTCLAVFVLFCMAASGTYLLNDVRDVHSDRQHERKRHRPVASGALPVPVAVTFGVLFCLTAPSVAMALGEPFLTTSVGGYVLLTLAYTWYLKNVVIGDLVTVAGCHVVRAAAGGVAVGVPLTSWFVLVISLAALLVVVGKREAELRAGGEGAVPVRATLWAYTPSYLAQTRSMASAAMIVTYCLWALDGDAPHSVFHAASIVPFVMFVLRYNLLVERGMGEEPEELALRDRPLQGILVALVALVGLGIHL